MKVMSLIVIQCEVLPACFTRTKVFVAQCEFDENGYNHDSFVEQPRNDLGKINAFSPYRTQIA